MNQVNLVSAIPSFLNHTSFMVRMIQALLFYMMQVMLILILIDVQYLQNVVFSFEKGSNSQNHSFLGSHQLKKNHCSKISHHPTGGIFSHTLTLFGKPCNVEITDVMLPTKFVWILTPRYLTLSVSKTYIVFNLICF